MIMADKTNDSQLRVDSGFNRLLVAQAQVVLADWLNDLHNDALTLEATLETEEQWELFTVLEAKILALIPHSDDLMLLDQVSISLKGVG